MTAMPTKLEQPATGVYWLNDAFWPDDPTKTDFYPVKENQTIREWLRENDGFARLRKDPAVCVVDGVELCHKDYDRPIDQAVCFVALPRGGDSGSNPFAAIAMIALMVVAPYAAGAVGGAMGLGTVGTAVVQAGIMIAGGAMINAMLPPPGLPGTATPSQGSPTYNIQAQMNAARRGQPVPVGYGRTICFGDLAAQPHTEFDENEHYINLLINIGRGIYDLSDIKLDLTPIENFPEAVYQIVKPFEKVELFHAAVANAPEAGGQDLNKPIAHGPYVINQIDDEMTRVAFDVVFPGGLVGTKEKDGSEYSVGVHLKCWVDPIDADGNIIGDSIIVHDGSISGRTRTAIRKSLYADLPPGRYQASVQRTTSEAPRNEIKNCQLTGIRGYIADDNEYGDLTLLAVRIRASENNVSTKVNCVAQRLLPVWHPDTGWSEPVVTRSPVWAFADAMRARYGGDFPDSELNLPELYWLAGILDERGDTFDGRFDTDNNLWSALEQIGQVCRSRPVRIGTQVRMLREQKQDTPVTVFSGANITDFSIDYVQASEAGADSVLMTYLDEEKGFQERTVLCQLPDSTAERPEPITLFGAVKREQVYQEGMFLVKSSRRRRQLASFGSGREAKVPKWGDLIHVSHPRLGKGKKFAGLVVAADGNNLTLSQDLTLDDDQTWMVVLRDHDMKPTVPMPFERISDNQIRITSVLPFTPETDPNRERTHFAIGIAGEVVYPMKVLGVEPSGEADVKISGVLEDDFVHDEDGSAPPLPPDHGIPPTAPGVIEDLRATQGGTVDEPVINLSWLPAARAEKYLIEVSLDNRVTWQPAGTGLSLLNQHSFAIDPGDVSVRVAAISMMRGKWAYLDVVAGGDFDKPGEVKLSLAEPFTGNALRVKWDEEPAAAHYLIEVWSGGKFRRSVFHERGITEYGYHYLDAQLDGAGRTLTVKVRAVNAQNIYGEFSELTATNPPPAVPDQVRVFEMIDAFAITAKPANEVVKELRVYGSRDEGFSPEPEDFLASSASTRVDINETGVWYFRVCWVDNWGESNLNFSGE
ncbi:host specificity factor TipJ family phage tail protein, partial [Endozoicomonas lisbonensis]